MRAMALNYDVTEQVKTRLNSIMAMGHPTDKLEVIIIGGTFLEYEKSFKYNYVKGIYDALNGVVSKDLDEAKKINETAKNRIVALCIENRPDSCSEEEIKQMLSYGTTRIEIGVQMPDDFLYKKVNRGHSVEDVVSATKRLKDSGFKVGYHIMPGLPFSTIENDKEKLPDSKEELDLHMQLSYKQAVEIAEEQALNVLLEGNDYELINENDKIINILKSPTNKEDIFFKLISNKFVFN